MTLKFERQTLKNIKTYKVKRDEEVICIIGYFFINDKFFIQMDSRTTVYYDYELKEIVAFMDSLRK